MRWKIGCLVTAAGFILMIAIGVMGAYGNVVPSLIAAFLILFGAAILIFALIASSIAIVANFWKAGPTAKPQERGSPSKPKQSGVSPANKPTAPPSPISRGRATLTRSNNMPIGYGSDFKHNYDDSFGEGYRIGRDEGYQEGYDEGMTSGYVLGSEEEYGDHIPEGAEWRHPDDDPTAR